MTVEPITQANMIWEPDVSEHSLILEPKRHSIPTDYFSNILEMSHLYSNYLYEPSTSWLLFFVGRLLNKYGDSGRRARVPRERSRTRGYEQDSKYFTETLVLKVRRDTN